MSGSLSEVGLEMLEVTALNEYVPRACAFSAFFTLWIVVIAFIPSLFQDWYTFSAYLIELTSIACLTVSLLFVAVDCRIAYHHVNELCAQASYETLSMYKVSQARQRMRERMRQHSIANNLSMILAGVNVLWFIVRVFFTKWTRTVNVVVFILLYFKELIYLLCVIRECARVNERANELSRILSQRMWRQGDVQVNLQRLSMVAMLSTEPVGFSLCGRRWTYADVRAVFVAVCLLSLLVLIRSILLQFSLTVLKD